MERVNFFAFLVKHIFNYKTHSSFKMLQYLPPLGKKVGKKVEKKVEKKMSMQEKSREKRRNEGKTPGEIENWKCDLVALNLGVLTVKKLSFWVIHAPV